MLQLSFVNFKPNSYVLVEGTASGDRFYIIQRGHVTIFREMNIPGLPHVQLGPGDFVGVVACMSGHNQTENVVAQDDVVAIMVRKEQYPELIMNNTPIAMKIVKSFAREMRLLNENLAKLTLSGVGDNSPESLYPLAEYFSRSGLSDVAVYAYYQYVKACPNGIYAAQAKQKFTLLKPKSRAVYLDETPDMMRNYPQGTMIFAEGQYGADMFIIQDGSVRISKVVDGAEVTLAVLQKGDMFGEMALLENKPRSACAIAHEDCRLMVVNRTNFEQMVATQPQLISKLTNILSDRLWAMYRQLANTQIKDYKSRLVDMLSIQLEKLKIPISKGIPYRTDFTPMDIAKMCAVPSNQLSRVVVQFQNDPIIRVMAGKITVPDVLELVKQAAFYRKQSALHASHGN